MTFSGLIKLQTNVPLGTPDHSTSVHVVCLALQQGMCTTPMLCCLSGTSRRLHATHPPAVSTTHTSDTTRAGKCHCRFWSNAGASPAGRPLVTQIGYTG